VVGTSVEGGAVDGSGDVVTTDVVDPCPSDVLDDVPSQAATARAISSSAHMRFETVMA
jgi:hypothetical protein